MRMVLEDWEGDIRINGEKFTNLRFADDTVLIAATIEEIKEIVHRLEMKSEEYGLKINYNKTKIMIIDRNNEAHPQPTMIAGCEVVDTFIYLGSLLQSSDGCELEIRRRIQLARTSVVQLTKIWRDRNITKNTKIHLVYALVFTIFSYASETWTLRASDRGRIDAFEMWTWRRMLRIPWTEKRTNVSILSEIKPEQRLSNMTYARILKFFGHITRNNPMERLVIQGKPQGKRRRGRSPTRWTDLISKLLDDRWETITRTAGDRGKWRRTIKEVIRRLDAPNP